MIVIVCISKQVVVISHVGSFILVDLGIDQVAKRSLSGNNVVLVFAELVRNRVIDRQNSAGDCAWKVRGSVVARVCGDLIRHFGVLRRRKSVDELGPMRQD